MFIITNVHRNVDIPEGICSKTSNEKLLSGQFSFNHSCLLTRTTIFKTVLLAKGVCVCVCVWLGVSDL